MSVITRSKALDIIDQLSDQLINLRMVLADQAHSMGDDESLWERQVEVSLFDVQKMLRRAKCQIR